jgi:hypothetical protein
MKLIAPLPSLAAIIAVLAWGVEGAAQQPARTSAARPRSPASATTRTADYTEQDVGGDQVVKFTGDELSGPMSSFFGTTIRPLPGPARMGLIRPRVNFVSELLKSVENL